MIIPKTLKEKINKIKCPICKSKLEILENLELLSKKDNIINFVDSWCQSVPIHYRAVFEWMNNNQEDDIYYEDLIMEEMCLFDEDYEYIIERFLVGSKMTIMIKSLYTDEKFEPIEINDPGIPLSKINLEKINTIINFR